MNRRDFIRISGIATLGAAAAGCSGTNSRKEDTGGAMEYRSGPTGKVSLLGYGCMRWPRTGSGKDSPVDQETVNELVDKALANGVNYFDTAPVYLGGESERVTGEALSRHPRNSYFIATKLSNFDDPSREKAIEMYESSLRNLRTDYLDYYLLHGIGMGGIESFKKRYIDNGILEFLKEERKGGRIRNLGFSFHGAKESFDHFMSLHDSGEISWDFCQIEMNYMDWKHADARTNVNADYLYAELERRAIPVLIMEPLLGGRLASVPEGISRQMKEREPDLSIASWAFRFCGSFPGVLTVLSGMTSEDHLDDNLKTFKGFNPLNGEELEFLEMMAARMKEFPLVNCTACRYCMPCPWGIDIPGIFKHYNTAVTEGTFAQTREQKDYLKLKRAYLKSYDRAVQKKQQADHCICCGQCVSHCPQGIKIPGELKRIHKYVESLKQDTI